MAIAKTDDAASWMSLSQGSIPSGDLHKITREYSLRRPTQTSNEKAKSHTATEATVTEDTDREGRIDNESNQPGSQAFPDGVGSTSTPITDARTR